MQAIGQGAAVGLGAIALAEQRVVRGASDADGRHHRSHLVALGVSMADGAAQGAHAASNQVKDRLLSAILSAVIAVLGNFETGVALHGHRPAVAELKPRFTAAGLHGIAIEHSAVRKEGLFWGRLRVAPLPDRGRRSPAPLSRAQPPVQEAPPSPVAPPARKPVWASRLSECRDRRVGEPK